MITSMITSWLTKPESFDAGTTDVIDVPALVETLSWAQQASVEEVWFSVDENKKYISQYYQCLKQKLSFSSCTKCPN